jgi:hypothetical protein
MIVIKFELILIWDFQENNQQKKFDTTSRHIQNKYLFRKCFFIYK